MRRLVPIALLLLVSIPASAQPPLTGAPTSTQTTPSKSHVWIDADVVDFQPSQDAQTITGQSPLYLETAVFSAAYPKLPTIVGFGISGGLSVWHQFGVSVR